MKKIVLLILCFWASTAAAQYPQPVYGNYSYPGSVFFDYGLYIPVRDTTGPAPDRVGAMVILPQDTAAHTAPPIRIWNGKYWGAINGIGEVPIPSWVDSLKANTLQRVMERGNISNRELLLDAGQGGGRLRFRTNPSALNLIYSYSTGATSFRPLEIATGGLMVSDRGGSVFDDDGVNALQVNGSGYFKSVVTGVPATAANHLTTRQQVSDTVAAAIRTVSSASGFPAVDAVLNGNRRLTGKNNTYSLTIDSMKLFQVNTTASGYSLSQQYFLFSITNGEASRFIMSTGRFEIGTGVDRERTLHNSLITSIEGGLTLKATDSVNITQTHLFQVSADSLKFSSNNRQNIQFPNFVNTPSIDSVLATDVNGYLIQRKFSDWGAAAGTNILTIYNDPAIAVKNRRWSVNLNAASGPGGIAGNDFRISSYNSSGSYISTPFWIERNSGVAYMPYGFISTGATHKISDQLDFVSSDMRTYYGSIGRELNSENNLRIVSNDSISFSNSLSGTPLMLVSAEKVEITPPVKLFTKLEVMGEVKQTGSIKAIRVLTESVTATTDDYTFINRAITGNPIITLPAASLNTGRIYRIVDDAADGDANQIVFSPVLFRGATYTSFNNPALSGKTCIEIQSDGKNWVVVGGL